MFDNQLLKLAKGILEVNFRFEPDYSGESNTQIYYVK